MRRKTKYAGITEISPNKFQLRVSHGKDPVTGKYLGWSENFEGTLRDAFIRRNEMLSSVDGKVAIAGPGWSMDQLMKEHFNYIEGKMSEDSVKIDRYRWNVLQPYLGAIKIRKIDTYLLDTIFDRIQRQRDVKGQTINLYRALLSAAFENAVRWNVIAENPVKKVKARRTEIVEMQLAEFKTIDLVLKVYETIDPKMGQLLKLSMLNSLRRGEACRLKASDYDRDAKRLRVFATKTQSVRVLALDDISIEILEKLIADCDSASSYLFSDDGGITPWIPYRVTHSQSRVRTRICGECGYYSKPREMKCPTCNIEVGVYWRVHDLRAWTTSFLISQGLSKLAQQRGGWSDETTMRKHYNRLMESSPAEAVNAINQRFSQ